MLPDDRSPQEEVLEAAGFGPGNVHSVADQDKGDEVGRHQEVDSGEAVQKGLQGK